MNIAAWLLAVVIAALLSAGGGYWRGKAAGTAAQEARQDHQAVADLNGLIESNKALIAQASTASRAMRQALARRATTDTQTTKELHDALRATAASRAGCVFDDGVLRQLAAARERAAETAASGIRGALPGAASGASQP